MPAVVKKHTDSLSGVTSSVAKVVPIGLFFLGVNDGVAMSSAQERVDGPMLVQQYVRSLVYSLHTCDPNRCTLRR
jgi:hypothetical protein